MKSLLSTQSLTLTNNGLSLGIVRNDPPLTTEVFLEVMARLGAILSIDYTLTNNTQESLKARALLECLLTNRWTAQEFVKRSQQFMSTVRFATWTIADFIGSQNDGPDIRSRVYPYSRYLEQCQTDATAAMRIGVYDCGDSIAYGWTHEIGSQLPRHEVAQRLDIAAQPSEPGPVPEQVEWMLRALKAERECERLIDECNGIDDELKRRSKDLFDTQTRVGELVEQIETLRLIHESAKVNTDPF